MAIGLVWTLFLPALTLPAASRRAALATGGVLLLQPMRASSTVAGDREVVTTIEVVAVKGKPPVKVTRPRLTGAGDPAWTFGQRDISSAIYAEPFPAKFPYAAADFKRLDEAPDTEFYKFPTLVYHIDEGAVSALTRYYDAQIPDGSDVLDICSSWVSHFPRDFPTRMKSLVGVGISDIELACNDQLSRHVAQDLNKSEQFLLKAQKVGNAQSAFQLYLLYSSMEGKKDIAKAYRYLNKAMTLGVTNFEQMNAFFRDNFDVLAPVFAEIRKPPQDMTSKQEILNLHDAYLSEL